MIGIVGGTGDFSQGLAERLRRIVEKVELGSRTPHDEFVSNRECAEDSDIVFLSVPPEGLAEIMVLEFETAEPIREVYRDGVTAGVFLDIDARLVAHNMLLTAHGWALKHWNLSGWLTLDEFIEQQLALLLASVRVTSPAASGPFGRGKARRQ